MNAGNRTAYRRGYDAERRVAAALTAEGYYVLQSRGSHGPADLAAIKAGQILLVQVKGGNADDAMLGTWVNALYNLAAAAGAVPVIADYPRRGRLRFRRITGTHTERSHTWPLAPFTTDEAARAAEQEGHSHV